MKKLEVKRETTTIRIEKGTMEKLKEIAVTEKISPAKWLEWAIGKAHQFIKPPEKMGNPFKEWGKGVSQKGELPPGLTGRDTDN